MFRSSFFRSPRPEQGAAPDASPASQNPGRFGALHTNVRSMINGSSIYSQSPAPSNHNTPKLPFLGFFRRPTDPDPNAPDSNDGPRASNDSRSPLRAQNRADSYMRTIAPLQDPRQPEMVYTANANDMPDRHPADVPLPPNASAGDPETQQLADEVNERRRRRRHRRKKHRRADHWVRRREEGGSRLPFVQGTAARGKLLACMLSGAFLATVLAIYLALALTNKDLGQEVHVLFIMVVLGTTIFFCHSLIRLFMLVLRPPEEQPELRMPNLTAQEGFQPVRPIRVHLARDEDLGSEEEDIESVDREQPSDKKVVPPPPAYGLWRSSVRVDPNLLHWQRVEERGQSPMPAGDRRPSAASTVSSAPSERPERPEQGPRPPSYASEDGVSYIMEAAPRSTIIAPSHSGISDIHPAWRPGYTVGEVRRARETEVRRLSGVVGQDDRWMDPLRR